MTKDDIIKLAREAGAAFPSVGIWHRFDSPEELERFATLVAAAERDKLQSAAEWCRMCERKGVFYEKATGDEANSPKVLGEG